jgi:hypothetical protein
MQWAQLLAGLPPVKGGGYHPFRRKFGNELRHVAPSDLLDLAGWNDYRTVLTCHQTANEGAMRAALEDRRTLEA